MMPRILILSAQMRGIMASRVAKRMGGCGEETAKLLESS